MNGWQNREDKMMRLNPLQSTETVNVTGDRALVTLVIQIQIQPDAEATFEPETPPAESGSLNVERAAIVARLKAAAGLDYVSSLEAVYGVKRGGGKAYKQAKQECDEWLAKQGEQDA
jgi:hypothetical protein